MESKVIEISLVNHESYQIEDVLLEFDSVVFNSKECSQIFN